jgi:hypothetical protein
MVVFTRMNKGGSERTSSSPRRPVRASTAGDILDELL